MTSPAADVQDSAGRLEFVNHSNWNEAEIKSILEWIVTDLGLKQDIKFVFQNVWTELDSRGEIVPGTERDSIYDGDWTQGGIVKVVISNQIQYPMIWDINSQLPGFYLRKANTFYGPLDFYVYFVAHELRHQYQEENPAKVKELCALLRCDDETDADIYATMTLAKFRGAAAKGDFIPAHHEDKVVHPYLSEQQEDDRTWGYAFWCPGCAAIDPAHGLHIFIVDDEDPDYSWEFDGEASFEPSLAFETSPKCHLHLTQGVLRYYPDCEHSLAGQNVDMVPIPPGDHEERD